MKLTKQELAAFIDHTLLKAEATAEELERICTEAVEYNFASVCVNPSFVTLAKRNLEGSGVKVCTVIGFPLGATTTESKVREAEEAITNGARELDMVINIGSLKSRDDDYVGNEIRVLSNMAHSRNSIVKVIIETCLLSDEEKERACIIAREASADFVKTSTGFSKAGATVADVALMRRAVGREIGVKASGGIKSYDDALRMIESGATRIGTSSGVNIILQSP